MKPDPATGRSVDAPAMIYEQNGTYQLQVTVKDGVEEATASITLNVSNVPPSFPAAPTHVTLLNRVTVLALPFVDPGTLDTHVATIDWGDGTGTDFGSVDENARTIAAKHTYASDDDVVIRVTLVDSDGGSAELYISTSATGTPVPLPTPTPTASVTAVATPTPTPTPSPTPTQTPTVTPSATASPTATPTATPTPAPTSPLRFDPLPALPPAEAGKEYRPNGQQYSFCDPPTTGFTTQCPPPGTTARNPSGGNGPYHFQLDTLGGFPPIGMFLGKDGQLTGTPDESSVGKTYVFVVCAVDLNGDSACQQVSITVVAAEPTPTPTPTSTPTPTPTPTATPTPTPTPTKTPTPTPTRTPTPTSSGGQAVTITTLTCTLAGSEQPTTIKWSYYRIKAAGTATGPVNASLFISGSSSGFGTGTSGWSQGSSSSSWRRKTGEPETVNWEFEWGGGQYGPVGRDAERLVVWFEVDVSYSRSVKEYREIRCQ